VIDLDPEYSAHETLVEKRDASVLETVRNLKNQVRKQPWRVIGKARFKKVWQDYGRKGIVRDEKGLAAIADCVIDNFAKLSANTVLAGHDQLDPEALIEDIDGERIDPALMDDPLTEYLTDDSIGQWRISDYAISRMYPWAVKALLAETDEAKLFAIDRMLNIAHQRSDLAAWFVEGGSMTLSEVSEYVPQELQPLTPSLSP
jgi:hypothetical protein